MKDLWKEVTSIGIQFHPSKVSLLVSSILKSSSPNSLDLSHFFGEERKLVERLRFLWDQHPELSPETLSGALMGASYTSQFLADEERLEMVWTGPNSMIVPSRSTRQVLVDAIDKANKQLFLISYVAYDLDLVMQALTNAIDRGVEVRILLESPKKLGGNIEYDSFGLFMSRIPDARLYCWNSQIKAGSVHAKGLIVDQAVAFITSANLTESAMERNMELGILIKGGPVPKKLSRHLQALIDMRVIVEV